MICSIPLLDLDKDQHYSILQMIATKVQEVTLGGAVRGVTMKYLCVQSCPEAPHESLT